MRPFLGGLAVILCLSSTTLAAPPTALDGTWIITAMIEDGTVVPEATIKNRLTSGGRLAVSGQTISFTDPTNQQRRTILFTTDESASPKTFDLSGADKVGSKGIYLLTDDVLMICLTEPEVKDRPTSFSAKAGSARLLLTLTRETTTVSKPPPPPAKTEPKPKPVEPKPPATAVPKDEQLREQLVATWGHQDNDWIHLVTFNSDGTYSGSRTYKHRFGKLFNENVRSSGTWKVESGVVILTCTASTNRDLEKQISSYRIRSITASEVISVDQFGRMRRDWKSK